MTTINYTSEFGFRLSGTEVGAWMDPVDPTTDLSLQGTDLTENGTLTKTAVTTGGANFQYSNFTAANYLERAYDVGFDVAEFSLGIWVNIGAVNDIETLLDRQDTGGTGARYNLQINADGTLRSTVSDGTDTRFVDGTTDLSNTGWNFIMSTWDNAGTQVIYINGATEVIDELGTAVGSLNNGTAVFRIGLSATGTDPCSQGVSLGRVLGANLSAAAVATLYETEKKLFRINAPYFAHDSIVSYQFGAQVMQMESNAIVQQTDSLGGVRQTIFNREDIFWSVVSTEVTDSAAYQFQNLLSSTSRGLSFTFDPDDLNEFVTCILESKSHTTSRIETSQYFTFSFKVKEI